jgi:hypothetical protein
MIKTPEHLQAQHNIGIRIGIPRSDTLRNPDADFGPGCCGNSATVTVCSRAIASFAAMWSEQTNP